jgi:hypothetical protein
MSIQIASLVVEVQSPKFRIYAIGENDKFPLLDYLETLRQSNSDSHERLIAMIDRYARHGPPRNDFRKARCLDKKEKIFEFKTNDGNRITWFYDAGSVIICTNGFPKPNKKRLRQDIQVAVSWKKRYETARDQQQVRILTCIP